jgi:hypothetical protein
MHPKTFFTHKKLEKFGIVTFDEREAYLSRYNSLPNLQLIEAVENKQKNAKKLDVWLDEAYPSGQEQIAFKHMHFFPVDESVSFSNFVNFYDARRALLKQKLTEILNVKVVETETLNNILN